MNKSPDPPKHIHFKVDIHKRILPEYTIGFTWPKIFFMAENYVQIVILLIIYLVHLKWNLEIGVMFLAYNVSLTHPSRALDYRLEAGV